VLEGVEEVIPQNQVSKLVLADSVAPQEVLAALVAGGHRVERFEIAVPTLDEIFIRVVSPDRSGGEA
jgi:ABC-2 type transport system ATP-binding protein